MNINKNILFVDDEVNILKSLKRLFMDEDFNVYTASSAKEGFEILSEDEFAVVVSDQRMPEITGTEFLMKVRELYPDTVRIILTGYADINAVINAINEAGAYRYITKPWNDIEIVQSIKEAAYRYHLTKENKYLNELTKKQNEELQKWSKELEYYVQIHTIDIAKRDKEIKKLKDKLNTISTNLLASFEKLIFLRSTNIAAHSERVAFISSEMAKKNSLSEEDIESIRVAGLLHDIGKIGLSDIILFKDLEELSTEEKNQYKTHPTNGQLIIGQIEDLNKVSILIRHHHENFDGSGFPDKLKGDAIPIGARIISLADRFERYSRYNEIDDSMKKIWLSVGKDFDKELFQVLEKVIFEHKHHLFSSEDLIEAALPIKDLMPGFVISRDVISSSGLIIIKKDTTLTEKHIELLSNSFYDDASKISIHVYKKRAKWQ
ncbi:MAG: response regulator [Thermodesulfovibrionales bacterium]|nr:response regulator [Thermodesulfovibrionales bacterium]